MKRILKALLKTIIALVLATLLILVYVYLPYVFLGIIIFVAILGIFCEFYERSE